VLSKLIARVRVPFRARLRDVADQRRRPGYRRLDILLRREGTIINPKKTQRICREEGLAVSRRRSRRRAVGARSPAPALPNQRWSLDFVHDPKASSRRFRTLCGEEAEYDRLR
jgi:putative transposase